jgi:hypothetical protein
MGTPTGLKLKWRTRLVSGLPRNMCTGTYMDGYVTNQVLTLVVESQLYTAGALVSLYAYTIGKLSNHKGR